MPRAYQSLAAAEPLPWRTSPRPGTQSANARFLIGRDRQGRWTVTDRDDRVGGIFASEAAAFAFARREANYDIDQICRSPDGVVIEFSLH